MYRYIGTSSKAKTKVRMVLQRWYRGLIEGKEKKMKSGEKEHVSLHLDLFLSLTSEKVLAGAICVNGSYHSCKKCGNTDIAALPLSPTPSPPLQSSWSVESRIASSFSFYRSHRLPSPHTPLPLLAASTCTATPWRYWLFFFWWVMQQGSRSEVLERRKQASAKKKREKGHCSRTWQANMLNTKLK